MERFTQAIEFSSTEKTDIIDVTERVRSIIRDSRIAHGIVTLFTTHTTTAIRINENERGLLVDIKRFLEQKAPAFRNYRHDDIDQRDVPEDEPINAHAHLKSLLLGASETVPLIDGSMQLGTWQSIFFIDLDGPRRRRMLVHIIGERK
jgi:secondary thiamine-phosphate synthase enzyme